MPKGRNLTDIATKKIQRFLIGFGLYHGAIDGEYGPRTTAAVEAFQRMHALYVDGDFGNRTKREMFPSVAGRQKPLKTKQSRGKFPHESQCRQFYGVPGKNQTKITLPYPLRLSWDPKRTVKAISCHKKVAKPMAAIFADTLSHYGDVKVRELGLDLYGGCLNVRRIRGGKRMSTHSWGIAVDIDPAHNRLRWKRTRARLAKPAYAPFWAIVKKHGAYSLGQNHNYDWMHFQFCYR